MEAITLDEVRAFAAEHFTPGNAMVVAVGDLTMDTVERTFQKHFTAWKGAAPVALTLADPTPPRGRTVYLIVKPGDSQSTLALGHLGPMRDDPNWEKAFVANTIFGGFFGSRLNLNLREDKGYTYGVRCQISERVGRGLLVAGGRVQAEVTAPAITEFVKELEDAAGKRPFTQAEVKVAKDYIVLGYARQFESVGQLAAALQNRAILGLPADDFVRYPDRVSAVDLAAANSAASETIHPKDMAIIVVGDLAKIEKSVRDLKLGNVVRLDREGRRIAETALSSK
jgi:zinc protease